MNIQQLVSRYSDVKSNIDSLEGQIMFGGGDGEALKALDLLEAERISLKETIKNSTPVTELEKDIKANFLIEIGIQPRQIYNVISSLSAFNLEINPDLAQRTLNSLSSIKINIKITEEEFKALSILLTVKEYEVEKYKPELITPEIVNDLLNGKFTLSPEAEQELDEYINWVEEMRSIDDQIGWGM